MPRGDQPLNLTLPERTAEIIRSRIFAHEPGYLPADRLFPSRLATDLGASVTPIREALKILAVDGLVVVSPRRGVRVVDLSEKELLDILEVQEGLDALAVAIAPAAADLAPLEQALSDAEAAHARGDVDECRRLSTEFHRCLVARSENGHLVALYETLLSHAQIIDVYYPRTARDVEPSIQEHREMVLALRSGRPATVDHALRHHWNLTRHRTSQRLRSAGRATDRRPAADRRRLASAAG